MKKTVVLNVVGLTPGLIGDDTPFLAEWIGAGQQAEVEPVLPAVTCSVQASYLTGTMPREHGIVANGWYFHDTSEIRFWMRSGRLIQGPKLWDVARAEDPTFTCANLFWRYAAYSGADYQVVERPMYPADGRKLPDIYAQPSDLRDYLQDELGPFPLFNFWGPTASITSSQWIADAAQLTDKRHDPTLTLIYLPHLDYGLQRLGPNDPEVAKDRRAIDAVCRDLITFYEERGAQVILLSEYGITPVKRPIALNRVLRRKGHLALREELGRELLDPGACDAFAVADHQLAHIYVQDDQNLEAVRELIAATPGVERVLDAETKPDVGLDHPRSGDLIAIAAPDAWFTYYYWLDDDRAPDFAPTVEIHRKPGYDPAELFMDPDLTAPKLRAAGRLLQKKLGFRYLMDVVPTHAEMVRGSHGRLPDDPADGPLIATRHAERLPATSVHATDVHDIILAHLRGQALRTRRSVGDSENRDDV
jgi:predicted AlkP superfamily pyrophosphatase or phosphodiesterase